MLKIILKLSYLLIALSHISFVVYSSNNKIGNSNMHYNMQYNNINNRDVCNKEKWINILIHGSVGLMESLSFSTLSSLISDQIENSFYERNVLSIRRNKNIFANQPIEFMGLHKTRFKSYSTCGAYLYSTLYNLISERYLPNQENVFYTYGWSGLISFTQRLKEAVGLYKALRDLIYRSNNCKIRIIGYSHGATLAFNLAYVREHYYPEDRFAIDEIVDIGMPIFSSTENLAKHPMFKKIYHIYSKVDWVQCLDVFSPGNFTSYNSFCDYKSYELKNKLTQFDISIYSSCKKILADESPTHSQLWFFGWSTGYNEKSILYPLPLSVFIPYFIFIAKDPYLRNMDFIKLKMYPNCNLTRVRDKYGYLYKAIRFIPKSELDFIKQYACKFAPKQYFKTNFYF